MILHMTVKTVTRHFLEEARFTEDEARADGARKIRIISEGRGSSGIWTREVLEKHYQAFNDVLSFNNHPGRWDGPETRDYTMIAGEIVGDVWLEEDERGKMSIAGWFLADPDDPASKKLERYRKKLGVSVYIEGRGFEREDGEFEISWLNENDPYRSVDVVIAPGRGGKFLESVRPMYDRASESDKPHETEGNLLMEKKIDALVEQVASLTKSFETFVTATEAAAQAQADAARAESEQRNSVAEFVATQAKIKEANLLPSQEAKLLEQAMAGTEVTDADVQSAQTIAKEARDQAGAQGANGSDRVDNLSESRFSDESVADYQFKSTKI